MGGLARIRKIYGGMKVTADGKTVEYVWDYASDKAVPKEEMPMGSARKMASERVKWEGIKKEWIENRKRQVKK
jgi:hypothetical protein